MANITLSNPCTLTHIHNCLEKAHDPMAGEEDEALIVVTPEEGGRRRRGSRGEVEDDLLDRTGTFRSAKCQWKTANR